MQTFLPIKGAVHGKVFFVRKRYTTREVAYFGQENGYVAELCCAFYVSRIKLCPEVGA